MEFKKPAGWSDERWAAHLEMIHRQHLDAQRRVKARIAVYEQAIAHLDSEPEPDEVSAHGLTAEAAKTYLLALIKELKRVFDL